MLTKTFQHLTGFSEKKERELWQNKIYSWQDYQKKIGRQLTLSGAEESPVIESIKKFQNKDHGFFTNTIPKALLYRLVNSFPEETIFLDIETTGLSPYYDEITLIGWSKGEKYNFYVNGDEKKLAALHEDAQKSAAIVTFNGSLFDLPFIRKKIQKIPLPQAHLDLRFFAKRLGYTGGQKAIENVLKIGRPPDICEMGGFEAVNLWYQYKEGNLESLKKLIKYNAHDLWGMKAMLEILCHKMVYNERLPFKRPDIFSFSKPKPDMDEIFSELDLKPREKSVPRTTLEGIGTQPWRVVGIDLTGSEARATGWAFIDGSQVKTEKIHLDKELIKKTIAHMPDIISIDSPLSLPEGRRTVFDDDPGRRIYGIMRECEKILKRRGVSSYPCLINSMQKLTKRGMFLANEFRKRGYRVIESYPGAAQDIMGIPRKRKSMEYLVKGIRDFGIKGDFDRPGISHDELDAITSAIVGIFYLADQYEAIGTPKEDYLIIPRLKTEEGL